jgi:hypothetical protein
MFRVPHFEVYDPNPVFDLELSRVKRLAAPDRLWLYSALVQAIPALVLLALFFLALNNYVAHYFQNNPSAGYYYYSTFEQGTGNWAALLLVAAGILFLVGDIYYIAVSVHSINHEINSGHWDLLRLTPMDDDDIIEAKLATAHIRAWRVMNLEVTVRLMLVTLFWAVILFPARPFLNGEGFFGRSSIWQAVWRQFQERPFSTAFIIITVLLFMLSFVLEPRWRMRALTGLGMYISSRVHNISMSSVAAFFSLIGFHFVQLVMLIASGWLAINVYTRVDYSYNYNYDAVMVMQLVTFLVLLGEAFFFYRLMTLWSQRAARRFAFRPDR